MATVVVVFDSDETVPAATLAATVRDLLASNGTGDSPSLEGVAYRIATVEEGH